MIAADVGEVQLAQAVAPIHVHRVHMEPFHRAVCDLELQLLARLGPLVPILGLLDHHAAGTSFLHHPIPGIEIVEWGGTGAVVHRRIGVAKPDRAVRASTLGRAAGSPVPFHAVDGHELSFNLNRLVGAGQIVGALGHLDRDDSRARSIVHAVHRYLAGGLVDVADGSHAGVVGGSGNDTVAISGHCEFGAPGAGVQRHACRTHGYHLVTLADGPGRSLGLDGAVPPLVVGRRGEGGGVAGAGVDLRLHRHGHLVAVVIGVPGRGLGIAVILQRAALGGDSGDRRPADGPVHRLLTRGAVRPHAVQQGKGGGVGSRIGLSRHRYRGVLLVKVVPFRRLGRPIVGEGALLCRDGHDDAGDRPLDLLGLRCPVPPLVVGLGGKGGGVIARVGSDPVAPNGHLLHIIAIPDGRLRRAVGRQHIALGGKRGDGRSADRPLGVGFVRTIGELIAIYQCEMGGVAARVDAVGFPADGHFHRVVPGPGRRLVCPIIGDYSILNGKSHLNRVDHHIQAGGLGHALIGIADFHRLLAQRGERGIGIGISVHDLGRLIRESSGDYHPGRSKLLQIVVGHFVGVGGDGNGYQHLLHRDGDHSRLGDAALGIGDGHLRDPVRQSLRRHGVSGHIRSETITIARGNDHARGVKGLSGLIDRLVGLFGDGQGLQLQRAASAVAAGHVKDLADVSITHCSAQPPVAKYKWSDPPPE